MRNYIKRSKAAGIYSFLIIFAAISTFILIPQPVFAEVLEDPAATSETARLDNPEEETTEQPPVVKQDNNSTAAIQRIITKKQVIEANLQRHQPNHRQHRHHR